jgi:hypothetical protein
VLADIHGHLPALDAVLADAEAAGADAVVLNGDIATGPMPAETLDRLVALGDRAIWVGGNADRELVEEYDGRLPTDQPDIADRRRFVNPGSVGMPYGETGAHWALLGPHVTPRRTEYDLAAAGETLRSAAPGYPGIDEFVAENVRTVPSDAEASDSGHTSEAYRAPRSHSANAATARSARNPCWGRAGTERNHQCGWLRPATPPLSRTNP